LAIDTNIHFLGFREGQESFKHQHFSKKEKITSPNMPLLLKDYLMSVESLLNIFCEGGNPQ